MLQIVFVLESLQGGFPIAPVAKEVGSPFNLLSPPLDIVSVKRKIWIRFRWLCRCRRGLSFHLPANRNVGFEFSQCSIRIIPRAKTDGLSVDLFRPAFRVVWVQRKIRIRFLWLASSRLADRIELAVTASSKG